MKFGAPAAAISAVLASAMVAPATAQDAMKGGATPQVVAPAAGPCCRVAAGTVVVIELAEPVSSRKQKRGDRFALRLAEPVVVDGRTVIPAGASGFGEVVDAAAAGIGGRPAKLILAARYLEYGEAKVLLHGFRLGDGGRDNSQLAGVLGATPYVGLLALGISGGEVAYPAGTRANAKVTADVTLSAPPPAPSPVNAPGSPLQGTTP